MESISNGNTVRFLILVENPLCGVVGVLNPSNDEMPGWPNEIMDTIHNYFEDTTKLLNVVSAKEIYKKENWCPVATYQPVYGVLLCSGMKNLVCYSR